MLRIVAKDALQLSKREYRCQFIIGGSVTGVVRSQMARTKRTWRRELV